MADSKTKTAKQTGIVTVYNQQGFIDHVLVDGDQVRFDELTFREQRDVRVLIRELTGNDEAEVMDVANMDMIPALVTVARKRDRPEYTVEEALDEPARIETLPAENSEANGRVGAGSLA